MRQLPISEPHRAGRSPKVSLSGNLAAASCAVPSYSNRGMATIRYKMGHLLNAMVPAIGFREEGLREPGHFQSEPSPKLLHRR